MRIVLIIAFFILVGCSKTFEPNPWTTVARMLTEQTQ